LIILRRFLLILFFNSCLSSDVRVLIVFLVGALVLLVAATSRIGKFRLLSLPLSDTLNDSLEEYPNPLQFASAI
jgi:hypothetical protein